jgi:hypothetical protein
MLLLLRLAPIIRVVERPVSCLVDTSPSTRENHREYDCQQTHGRIYDVRVAVAGPPDTKFLLFARVVGVVHFDRCVARVSVSQISRNKCPEQLSALKTMHQRMSKSAKEADRTEDTKLCISFCLRLPARFQSSRKSPRSGGRQSKLRSGPANSRKHLFNQQNEVSQATCRF